MIAATRQTASVRREEVPTVDKWNDLRRRLRKVRTVKKYVETQP